MHELPVVNHILEIVLRHAQSANAKTITAVRLRIGALSELEDEWFIRYFEYVSKGTPAEGAEINIERLPVVFLCENCRNKFPVDVRKMEKMVCPSCGENKAKLFSGREFQIKEIEVI